MSIKVFQAMGKKVPEVYFLLRQRYKTKYKIFPTVSEMAGIIGCSERVIYQSLSELERAGFIQRFRQCRESNFYIVNDCGNTGISKGI